MSDTLPPEPEFGAALPIGDRHQSVLDFLALRRSASAATLRAPAPTAGELAGLLRLAVRVPDHGKLSPWRFIVLEGEAKTAFAGQVEAIAEAHPDAEKARGALFKLKLPPLGVVVVSRHIPGKIPEWEQRLSAGAVCITLVNAAQAMGYGANWITDWYSFDPKVATLLGLTEGEQIAGFVFLGTASEAPLERVRPDVDAITSRWAPAK
ncbi:MAG: nitroreductase [Caulobacteraceae bacterium]|nr:nitroreductase [Caulobacteraceae bacterium]